MGGESVVVITSTLGAMMAAVAGLSERRLGEVRGRLEAFADEVFDGAIGRSEQRKWGGVYLRGLMLDGKRKSVEPMAARLADGDEQCLQQFVTAVENPARAWSSIRQLRRSASSARLNSA